MYDILITNGKVIDGTGNPWFYGDIGISGNKIAFVGKSEHTSATTIINAEGSYVAPGFIDIHTHSDFTILPNPTDVSKIHQGITTEIGGNCGFSLGPVNSDNLESFKKFVSFMPAELNWNWHTIGEFLALVKEQGTSINFGTLVGQGVLRIAAMGYANRNATDEEMRKIECLLEQALVFP